MNKQELIDALINTLLKGKEFPLSGVKFNGGNFSSYMGYLVEWVDTKPVSICSMLYLAERTRELGWVNGYKFGVEYPTGGNKPNLPSDIFIEAKVAAFGWGNKFKLGDIVFDDPPYNPIAFRIVDERYKPVAESLEKSQQLWDWYERGELPPAGAVCEMLDADLVWRSVEIIAYTKKGVVVEWDDKEFLQSKDRKFRPIKSERDRFIDSCISSLSEFRSANQVFGELFDSGKFMLKE